MKKYTKEKDGIKTEFEFVLSENHSLDSDLPISTPMTFAFIGQDLILLEKDSGWWDVPSGKMEKSETWEEVLKKGVLEEAGVVIDHITTIGYIKTKTAGGDGFTIPVTISFVKEVCDTPLAKEVVQRQALKRSEAKEVLGKRGDNGQLAEIFAWVINFYDSQNYEFEFEYIAGNKESLKQLPKTQAMVFVKTSGDKFFAVRDADEEFYSLPGGGCYMNETDEECATREVKEEAQCDIEGMVLLGTVVVRVKKDTKILSESRQLRYLAQAKNIKDFISEKDGFEIVERKEVDLNFLFENTKILKNDTGVKIIEALKRNYLT